MGWWLSLPIVEFLLVESAALTPGYALAGLALDRRLTIGLIPVLVGVGFGLAVPPHAPLGILMAQVGSVVAAAIALWIWPSVPAVTDG